MNLTPEICLKHAFRELEGFSVPGLGTFEKEYQDAFMDEAGKIVHPPNVRLRFTETVKPALRLNQHLIHNLRMSPHAASQLEEAICEEIMSTLDNTGFYELPEIGRLVRPTGGPIRIQANEPEDNALSDPYFGLLPVTMPVNTLPNRQTPSYMFQASSADKSRSSASVVWRSALLVLLIGALGVSLVSFGPFNKRRSAVAEGVMLRFAPPETGSNPAPYTGDTYASSAPAETPAASAEAPASQSGSPAQPGLSADGSNARLAAPAGDNTRGELGASRGTDAYGEVSSLSALDTAAVQKTATRQVGAKMNYHLVAGSFSTLAAANKFKNQMVAEGYSPVVMYPEKENGIFRISLFRSENRKEVETFAEKLRKLGKNPGWIYEAQP
ncbi:MAG: SPOR domain-containing protein [Bacteroidetes bacterium]|nr:MAG: SPOR domain-containing protein [Bacteroidota bacterium]